MLSVRLSSGAACHALLEAKSAVMFARHLDGNRFTLHNEALAISPANA
jgi:hypothetical protein